MPDICSVNYTADPVEWYLLLQIPDMWRIIMPVDPAIEPDDAVQERSIQASLQNLLPRAEPYDIVVKAIYRVSQRVAARYREGRAFLAGDAAHINNPLGGMGLNGGIHDALSLTGRLARVWHGAADDRLLDGYEAQRRPEAISDQRHDRSATSVSRGARSRGAPAQSRGVGAHRGRSGARLRAPPGNLDDRFAAGGRGMLP